MLGIKLIRFLMGYLTIRVEGINIERFLNMSVARGTNYWDIKRISMTTIELKLSITSYRSLKKILKKTSCKLSILDKGGLPFLMLKIKKRKMLATGFGLFILLVFALSSFVWSIKITGANSISIVEVEKNLAELGVVPGALKLNISVAEIENNMLIKMKGISWIKVKLVGTRAEVEIKERVVAAQKVPDDKPCNVVAIKDGIIISVVSSQGNVVIASEEPVKKGQLLVTGIIERNTGEKRYVHAAAQVSARTWYETKVVVPLEKITKERTGRYITNISLMLGEKRLAIKNSNITYKNYDKIIKSTKLIDTDRFKLPVEIMLEEYHETKNGKVILTIEQAKKEAEDAAEKQIIDNMPSNAKIINKKINTTVKDNVVITDMLIETIEDIGTQEEITVNEEV